MKTLAIDYGTKEIGLATSNDKGTIAFPHSVIENNNALKSIQQIVTKEGIEKIVVGVPEYNKETDVYKKITNFIQTLKTTLSIPIETQDELLTSQAAQKKSPQQKNRHDLAAQIILEDYLSSQ